MKKSEIRYDKNRSKRRRNVKKAFIFIYRSERKRVNMILYDLAKTSHHVTKRHLKWKKKYNNHKMRHISCLQDTWKSFHLFQNRICCFRQNHVTRKCTREHTMIWKKKWIKKFFSHSNILWSNYWCSSCKIRFLFFHFLSFFRR
jgi:transposase